MIGESLWLDDVTWVERHPGQRGKSEIQFTGRWSGGIPIDEPTNPASVQTACTAQCRDAR
jgi:hypothetical protein